MTASKGLPEVDPRFAHAAIALRVARGWSVDVLADRSGLSADAVSRIEHGRPVTAAEAGALAEAFGETVAAMAGVR